MHILLNLNPNSGPGSAVMLVPGGAAEALLTAPGTCDLVSQNNPVLGYNLGAL